MKLYLFTTCLTFENKLLLSPEFTYGPSLSDKTDTNFVKSTYSFDLVVCLLVVYFHMKKEVLSDKCFEANS